MIEGVESLPAQLAGKTLAELYVLEERKVCAPEAWSANGAGAFRGFGSLSRGGRGEGVRVEPITVGIWGVGVGVANLIRAAA